MSIALNARIKELEAKVDELAYTLIAVQFRLNNAKSAEELNAELASMNERIEALKRKPGRPPKEQP
jgi:chromosome segregation ATPase